MVSFVSILAIKNALKQENLNPEIEEKLLNLQRFQEKQMKGDQQPTSIALAHNHHEYTSPVKAASVRKQTSSRTQLDNEWLSETPKRRPPRANSSSEKKNSHAVTASTIESDVNRIIRSVEEETAAIEATKTVTELQQTPPKTQSSNRRIAAIKRESEKKKQKQQLQVNICARFFLVLFSIII